MNAEQLAALYHHLCRETDDAPRLLAELARRGQPYGSPEEAALYLPMYSIQMDAGNITPRIEWLRQNGWDLAKLVNSGAEELDQISSAELPTGKFFGMLNRVEQLAKRALQIHQYGVDRLRAELAPVPNWNLRDLLVPLRALRLLDGVGPAAAFHVLMELNWEVVKPDVHMCRFLRRMSADWDVYWSGREVFPEMLLAFEVDWRAAGELLSQAAAALDAPIRDEVHFPKLAGLTLRQLDFLVMLYTQDLAPEDADWRPAPICTHVPSCQLCSVPNCRGRPATSN